MKNIKTLDLMGVLAILLILGGFFWIMGGKREEVVQGREDVKWINLSDAVRIKTTAPVDFYNESVGVVKVGDIVSGKYAGKILVLAAYEWSFDEYFNLYTLYVANDAGEVVAWDEAYIQDFDERCYEVNIQGCERHYSLKSALNFTDANKTSFTFLPKEMVSFKSITSTQKKAYFVLSNLGIRIVESLPESPEVVDTTSSGLPIVKVHTSSSEYPVIGGGAYYIQLPFGAFFGIQPEPTFVDKHDVPDLTWSIGTKEVVSYRYGQYAYGWQDCYKDISPTQAEATLMQTGINKNGDPVFEPDPQKNSSVFKCLHEKTKRYEYDDTTSTGKYVETIAYEDFIKTHPLFYWKHPIGEFIVFVRSDVVPAAEKAKPVIYLYPETTQNVSVKVAPVGGFTVTDPEYGNGWEVTAKPNSHITNIKDGKTYPYLFWEGGKEGIVNTPKEGFVVSKEDVSKTLEEKLIAFGLNEQERKDFIEFWTPKLSQAPYYFITFISRSEIDRVAPMTISPRPESVIRVLMDYKPLNTPISVSPLKIDTTERKGFTVVEWGGIVR